MALAAGIALLPLTMAAWPRPASAQLPPPPKEVSLDQHGVDGRTGNEVWSARELDIGPDGDVGLHFVRHHSEGLTRNAFASTYYMTNLGDGFHSVNASFGNIGDTFATNFYPLGSFVDESNYRYQAADGTIVTFGILMWNQFNPFGDNSEDLYRLADTVTYPNGVKLTLHYRVESVGGLPLARIQSVTSNTGYQLKFKYGSNTATAQNAFTEPTSVIGINMATEYCNPTADDCALNQSWPTVTYAATTGSNSYTLSVTDAKGGITQYVSTSGSSPTFSITPPGYSSPIKTFGYTTIWSPCQYITDHTFCSMGTNSRVSSVTTPDRTTTYAYSGNSNPSYFNQITSTDPGAITKTFKSQGYNQLGVWSVTDPYNRLTKFEYNTNGQVTKATWPEGNFTVFQRDSYGRVTQEILHGKGDTATLTLNRTFGACAMNIVTCSLPLTVTDARNKLTEYRYNTHGQKTVEIGPADQNGVRPLRRWFYADKFAYVKNASGTLVAAPTAVSVLTSEIVCKSTFNGDLVNPACGSTADEVVTTYEYPASAVENAILPRGMVVSAGGAYLRTCYGYDRFGNKISETRPRGDVSSCS